MKRLTRWAMLAVLAGAGVAANAQVYENFDDFNDGVRTDWNGGEILGDVEETGGLMRISRSNGYYAGAPHQWINLLLVVPGPYWEYDMGVRCNGYDTFRIIGMARAPHRISQRGQKVQIGIGFLDAGESEIGLLVQDSMLGRSLVATYCGTTVKSADLGETLLSRWWLKITYSAATRTFTYWWSPSTLRGAPLWSKFCTYQRPLLSGKYYLDPGLLGHIYGTNCPPEWNVGLDSFSLHFENK